MTWSQVRMRCVCGHAAISADGRVPVSNSHGLEIWNAETGERLDFIEDSADIRCFFFAEGGDEGQAPGRTN